MHKKEAAVYIKRIERFYDRMADMILSDSFPFEAEFRHCPEPVKYEDRLSGSYKPVKVGDLWGQAWDSAWFHLQGQIPESWKGEKVVAHMDFSGEGLVHSSDGKIMQGITNGSVFRKDFSRDVVHLFDKCSGGEEVELWVETAANELFGVYTVMDPALNSPKRYGYFDAIVNLMELCVFDADVWNLFLDLRTALGLIKHLPENSVRRVRLLKGASDALDEFKDDRKNAGKCTEILREELNKPSVPSELTVYAVGHAHIDTAWLWTVNETVRKCARTFSSQIDLLKKYPEYIFGASQPQHYQFTKDNYPQLYEEIKRYVKAGRWELQGGMWVESDCNLVNGESLVRQILYGKNYFMDEFGIEVDNLWLPDVFGYPASLPQIMLKSGLKYFLTQKLSWNQYNEFPHHTFLWRGIDGSEVLTHFPPENTYNSDLATDYILPARDNFHERDFVDCFISLFGTGDGGGGPKEENIELGRRMENLEGSPKVKFGTAKKFFNELDKYRDELAVWQGELYLEFHRGTPTSQAQVKRYNRMMENRLRETEFLWSCLPLNKYPQKELEGIWKKLLVNQFHDILPGSSITETYKVTIKEYEEAIEKCDKLIIKAGELLFTKDDKSIVLFNPNHSVTNEIVSLSGNWKDFEILDENGNIIPSQIEDNRLLFSADVPPYSFKTILRRERRKPERISESCLKLENDLVRYEFNENGELIDAFDKEADRSILEESCSGNILTLFEDRPNDFDAWDIDIFYENAAIETAKPLAVDLIPKGEVRQGIVFRLKAGDSLITQKVTLNNNGKRLDFDTTVDWKEKHKMLRVAFPLNIVSETASFDIPYGYCERNTHRNTLWDTAKFEVPGQRYADLSDNGYGVALINDCKYGYKVLDNVLDLNLLRSPTYPDPDADQGNHRFRYALYPHIGDLVHSDVIETAVNFNRLPIVFEGQAAAKDKTTVFLEGEGLSLEVLKKAEKEDCLVIRIIETRGCNSSGRLYVNLNDPVIHETNLMEWENGEPLKGESPFNLTLKPFEIRTYKIEGNFN